MARIALVGGTGDLGKALALAWCSSNHILIGSRSAVRALNAVNELKAKMRDMGRTRYLANISSGTNEEVVRDSHVVVLSVPYNVEDDFLREIGSQIDHRTTIISPVSPFRLDKIYFQPVIRLVNGRPISFAERVRELMRSERVVSALQTLPAPRLYTYGSVRCHVPVAGDNLEATEIVMNLLRKIRGVKPVFVGPLATSLQIEFMTPMLLNISKYSKMREPSIVFV